MDYQQRIRHLALASIILAFIQVQNALGSTVTSAPSDVVARPGENPQFSCKITPNSGEDDAVEWLRTPYGKGVESIYKTYNPKPLDKVKYDFIQSETDPLDTKIVVKNLALEDAGAYRCQPMGDTTNGKTAELVIVDSAIISVQSILEDGKPGSITCDIFYLRSDNTEAESIEPQLFASIGAQNIATANKQRSDPTGGDNRYKWSLFYNETMHASQHGQNFTCGARVTRDSPTPIDFTFSVNKELTINSPTTKLEITEPVKELYYPGDNINCTADGFPEPKIQWIPIKSDGAAEISGGILEISEQMIGNNTWKCKVSQYGSPPVMMESREITFQVLSPTEPPTGKSSGADSTTIAVAVAVPLAVLLAVLIVVCIVCKKKKAQEPKPKRGEGVEAGTASQKQRNQIYKPVSTNPEGQVRFQEEKASYKPKDSADRGGRPSPAPRHPDPAEGAEEIA